MMKKIIVSGVFVLLCAGILLGTGASFAAGEDPWQKMIDFSIKDMPIAQALDQLLRETGISYTIADSIKDRKVTAIFKKVSLDTALREIGKAAGLKINKENGVVSIEDSNWNSRIDELEHRLIGLKLVLMDANRPRDPNDPDADDLPDPKVFEFIIAETEKQLAIERERESLRSYSGTIPELQEAKIRLEQAVKSYDRAERKSKAGLIPNEEMEKARTEMELASVRLQAAEEAQIVTEVIQPKYLKPSDLIPMFRALGVQEVMVTGGRKLTVMGPKKAVNKAKDLVASMDEPSAIPKLVRVTMIAKFVMTSGQEPPKTSELSVTGFGSEGETIHLSNKGTVQNDRYLEMDMSLIPGTITDDNEINVSAEGVVKYGLLDKEPGIGSFKSTRRLTLGTTVSIGGGSMTYGDTKVEYELTFSAGLEKEPKAP